MAHHPAPPPEPASRRDTDDIELHPCPRCGVDPGSSCRSRSGAVAGTYHTGRFTQVPRLTKLPRAQTPADRRPGQPWRPGTTPPAPIPESGPTADIRIGYARCSTVTQELQYQLDALAAHGIPRDKIFSEKISTRVRVRPQFQAALALAREIKAHAPHCRVILTVYEMKRLGRDATELTALADHLTAHGPGPGNARRTPARHLRPDRVRQDPVRLLRRHGRDRTARTSAKPPWKA